MYANSTMTDLGTLGNGNDSYATGINDAGQIAGYATTTSSATGPEHAFLLDAGGSMEDLGTLGGDSQATAINNMGQVVGYSVAGTTAGSPDHAFLWSSTGGMQDLGTLPGYKDSYALAVNDSGQVVGYDYATGDGGLNYRAFLESDGTMTDLNSLLPEKSGWVLYTATAINNQGVIGGMGTYNGKTEGYLLYTSSSGSSTPTPTPTSTLTTTPTSTPTSSPGTASGLIGVGSPTPTPVLAAPLRYADDPCRASEIAEVWPAGHPHRHGQADRRRARSSHRCDHLPGWHDRPGNGSAQAWQGQAGDFGTRAGSQRDPGPVPLGAGCGPHHGDAHRDRPVAALDDSA